LRVASKTAYSFKHKTHYRSKDKDDQHANQSVPQVGNPQENEWNFLPVGSIKKNDNKI
jgi:hypothetical protein